MKKIIAILTVGFLVGSCSQYQKVLKEKEVKPKYEMAVKLYEEGLEEEKNSKLKKVLRLLEQILPQYQGKPQGEKISYINADTYYQLGDNFSSGYQFERFTKAYPKSEKLEEAYFKTAKSYYNISPRYSLDQTETHKAIAKLQEYITRFPDGENIGNANELVAELRDKLEKKEYEVAKQYHHTENYKASIAAMDNFIEAHPGSKYRERAYFYKFDSAYLLAINSYVQLVPQRLQIAKEYYEDYKKYYLEGGEYTDRAKEISNDIADRIKNNLNKKLENL